MKAVSFVTIQVLISDLYFCIQADHDLRKKDFWNSQKQHIKRTTLRPRPLTNLCLNGFFGKLHHYILQLSVAGDAIFHETEKNEQQNLHQ